MNAAFQIGYGAYSGIRRSNVWWTISDGDWNDRRIWYSNGRLSSRANGYYFQDFNKAIWLERPGVDRYASIITAHPSFTPQPGDTVIINHNVTCSSLNSNYTKICENVIVNPSGSLTLSSISMYVNGITRIYGLLSMGTSDEFVINDGDPVINSMTDSGTVIFTRYGDQLIPSNISYRNLILRRSGNKYPDGNLQVNGNLQLSIFDTTNSDGFQVPNPPYSESSLQRVALNLGEYSLTVNGTSSFGFNSCIRKYSSTGSITFIGACNFTGSGLLFGTMDFIGNINVEFRGGLSVSGQQTLYLDTWKTGTGTFRFTTNSQNVNHSSSYLPYSCLILIDPGITVTAIGGGRWQINNDIEGVSGTSILDNRGYIGYAGIEAMQTGQLICNIASNTFEYNGVNQNVKDVTYWKSSIH